MKRAMRSCGGVFCLLAGAGALTACNESGYRAHPLSGSFDVELTQRLPGEAASLRAGRLLVDDEKSGRYRVSLTTSLPLLVTDTVEARAKLPAAKVSCEGDASGDPHVLRTPRGSDQGSPRMECRIDHPCVEHHFLLKRTLDLKREAGAVWQGELNLLTRWTCTDEKVDGFVVRAVTLGDSLAVRLEQ